MTRIAIFPGSFDPFTNGHLSLVERSLRICDELIIAIGVHSSKRSFMDISVRESLISDLFSDDSRIRVLSFSGLIVDFARDHSASFIVRGLRNVSDMEYEMQMAEMNETMSQCISTIFLPTMGLSRSISSTLVRQIASMGGNIGAFVPATIADAVNSISKD